MGALGARTDFRSASRWAALGTGLSLVLLASAVSAHGDMRHVLGTVRDISANHIVVETKSGEKESIVTDPATRYFHGDAAAKPADLQVGDRVVVHATQSDPPTAKTIRFATPKAAP
jgi:hypothetical protein